ncbi:ATP-binding cassette domain-containing protein [Domibacillus indicus]|uniref:ATP-binding cassette domain-containing protein n=1 Tax=Domibacillus indicus TaxID=1437523 RepID=UPI000617E73E|nr:ABC transporter ATP-binding protein [Domibacillus indicus]
MTVQLTRMTKSVDDFSLGPVDLTLEPGTVTVLAGSNSSGKSLLLKTILNLVKKDDGEVKIFGEHVPGNTEQWIGRVGYMPQALIGCETFTGEELKSLVSRWYPNWDDCFFNTIAERLNIPLKKKYGKMSKGAQQKLSFALTIPRNPELLLLDEPTSHMDIPAKQIWLDILVEWMEAEERTILMATHNVDEIRKIADYISVMRNGKIIGTFEKEAFTRSYKRYWLHKLPVHPVPGEAAREEGVIISRLPFETEQYFRVQNIEYTDVRPLDLEEIITMMLKG